MIARSIFAMAANGDVIGSNPETRQARPDGRSFHGFVGRVRLRESGTPDVPASSKDESVIACFPTKVRLTVAGGAISLARGPFTGTH
jgi:hypothetical protein